VDAPDARGGATLNDCKSPRARISALGPGSGSAAGSSQPEPPGANRLRASAKWLSGDSARAPALPNLQRSGHQAAVTPVGVEEPRSVRLATADADLPSLSYGHLVGDGRVPRLL
jgi:hypothetical protein